MSFFFLLDCLMCCLQRASYSQDWAKAIIIPIHKKGNIKQVDNYRGVFLFSVVSKCYTAILNAMLYSWLKDNNVITKSQLDFLKTLLQYSDIQLVCDCSDQFKQKKDKNCTLLSLTLEKPLIIHAMTNF